MPFISHHFQEKERSHEVPPWGVEPPGVKSGPLTTHAYMFQGLKGLPAVPIRNNTTNHFDPQSWRDKSSYKEQYATPPNYSRHNFVKASANRNNRPHPNTIVWPLEPNKGYMIWKPKVDLIGPSKPYTAPNLLRNFYTNKWKTTNQTTYQNFYEPLKTEQEKSSERSSSKLATVQSRLSANKTSLSSDVRQSRLNESRQQMTCHSRHVRWKHFTRFYPRRNKYPTG